MSPSHNALKVWETPVQIRIPHSIYKIFKSFEAWGDKEVYGIRRIDYLIAIAFTAGSVWYYFTSGGFVMLQFMALFVFLTMCIIWFG
jgi:hypothetical protein